MVGLQLRELRHENVNPFVGCYVDILRPALVYEFCQRRSLQVSNEKRASLTVRVSNLVVSWFGLL